MSSATSTEGAARGAGFRLWHFYVLLGMVGATVAVMLARQTHPVALLLLSAAVVAAGFVGLALHRALASLLGRDQREPRLTVRSRDALEREKALILRSIKELEFDHAMGKVDATDFANIGGRLRARALTLMQDLERTAEPPARQAAAAETEPAGYCPKCGTPHDADANFCKKCGTKL